MSIIRRLRATLAIAALWGLTWAACGVALGAGRIRAVSPFMLSGVAALGACGFVGGAGFALVLSRAERRQHVANLSTRRSAAWGSLGGGLAAMTATMLLGPWSSPNITVGISILGSLLGSVSAVATVRVAQAGLRSAVGPPADAPEREPARN